MVLGVAGDTLLGKRYGLIELARPQFGLGRDSFQTLRACLAEKGHRLLSLLEPVGGVEKGHEPPHDCRARGAGGDGPLEPLDGSFLVAAEAVDIGGEELNLDPAGPLGLGFRQLAAGLVEQAFHGRGKFPRLPAGFLGGLGEDFPRFEHLHARFGNLRPRRRRPRDRADFLGGGRSLVEIFCGD